jgi:hypothetical protein
MRVTRRKSVTATRTKFWRSHRVLAWVGGLLLLSLTVLASVVLVLAHRAEPLLRAAIVQGLSSHFHARVELDSFHLSLKDGLWAEGKGLRVWAPVGPPEDKSLALGTQASLDGGQTPAGTASGRPLIQLAEFRFHAPLDLKPGAPIRISVARLTGLEIDVPPRPHVVHSPGTAVDLTRPTGPVKTSPGLGLPRFQVDSVECEGAHVTVEASKPGKLPLEFAIAHLTLTKISAGGAMDFAAELTNPRPVGTIHTKGSFGPWMVEDPGESPLAGTYVFEKADLGGFKGIAGILDSTGRYQGTLRDMLVDGETETPDFRLTRFGTALHLHTRFHAQVDGTNGDTRLEPVEATLGRSHFWARGEIVRTAPGAAGKGRPGGRDIELAVNVDRGRIEDFLRLASRSGIPLLTGALTMKAQLAIPPGPMSVDERLSVGGTFALEDAQFLGEKIQHRIAELSARGLGRPKDAKGNGDADVRSTMKGSFQMANKNVTLSALEYTVPGAVVDLSGSYGVETGELNFAGTAKMQATVSAMVGGWKGLLLKPVDRYFQKNGAGTEVPIHITGTRESPQFGIDFNRMKGTSAQRPDEPRK